MPVAAKLTAPRTVEIARRPPLQPGPMEVVVGVEAAGICGTDLALFRGDYPVPLPLVPGHEFAGTVRKLGSGVDPAWLGRRVTAEINNTCLAYHRPKLCSACARGLPSHCLDRTVTGIIRHDGAFADEIAVPAGALHTLPDGLDAVTATLAEPLAAALETFVMSPAAKGDLVVVLGPGRLGVLIVFAARQKGLRVVAISRSEQKRARSLAFGAEAAFAPHQAIEAIHAMTGGMGADMVVDATGNPEGLTQALKLVRPRGTLAAKTTCGLPPEGFDLTRLVVDEIRLQGSRCGPFTPALELLARHPDKLRGLITRTRPLAEAQEALCTADQENKVVLISG